MTHRYFPALAAALLLSGPLLAQDAPGVHFIENWDLDEDGQVTLAEAHEKRGDIFYMFDQDEDGVLTGSEYDLFDETRAAEMAAMKEENQGTSVGQGQGQGKGQGRGKGQGQGRGKGGGRMALGAQGGGMQMSREVTDLNGDGGVTRAEFLEGSAVWFTRRDRNDDQVITVADFGPGH